MLRILHPRQAQERYPILVGIDEAREQMGRARTGRGDAASQRAAVVELGVRGRGLRCVDLAAAVHPRDAGVGLDGVDEGNDRAAVPAEDVRDARRRQGVDEELGPGEGPAAGAVGRHDSRGGIVVGISGCICGIFVSFHCYSLWHLARDVFASRLQARSGLEGSGAGGSMARRNSESSESSGAGWLVRM